jgi:hypothetical protein
MPEPEAAGDIKNSDRLAPHANIKLKPTNWKNLDTHASCIAYPAQEQDIVAQASQHNSAQLLASAARLLRACSFSTPAAHAYHDINDEGAAHVIERCHQHRLQKAHNCRSNSNPAQQGQQQPGRWNWTTHFLCFPAQVHEGC